MADDESTIHEIRRRWLAAGEVVDGWAALPVARRQRVLGELEETALALRGGDDELASDLTVALDALDALVLLGSFDLVRHAAQDIRTLLTALDHASRRTGSP